MPRKVESMSEIYARWRAEGRQFRPHEVTAEWQRQVAWRQREIEDEVLALAPDSEAAAQVRDHRAAGNWTTWHRDPVDE